MMSSRRFLSFLQGEGKYLNQGSYIRDSSPKGYCPLCNCGLHINQSNETLEWWMAIVKGWGDWARRKGALVLRGVTTMCIGVKEGLRFEFTLLNVIASNDQIKF